MGQLFQQALRLAKDRQSLLEAQRLWLVQRDNTCGALADTAIWSCLLEMTKSRATALAKPDAPTVEVTQIAKPTPGTVASTTSESRPAPSSNVAALNSPSGPTVSPVSQKDSSANAASQDGSSWFAVSLVVGAIGLVLALSVFNSMRRKQRIAEEGRRLEELRLAEENRLIVKYGEEIATRILARQIWQGMTEEQLVESRGNPADVGREIIKARIKETWKYGQTGRNRFSHRIYLENGIVIGWKI